MKDEGLFETADHLTTEAHLTNEYQVCDNIDLDIILQDYANYYFIKFNKNPLICKKIKEGEAQKIGGNADVKRSNAKSRKCGKNNKEIKNEDDPKKSPEEAFIITQLKDRVGT